MRLGLLESVTQLNSHALSGIPLAFLYLNNFFISKERFIPKKPQVASP